MNDLLVLGVDASAGGCGAAVVDAAGVRGACWAGPGARPAAALLALADQALRAAGADRTALQGVAAGVGPGSYAGVRAAVATAKALAWAGDLPLAGVGSLQALAWAAGPWPGTVWAATDARRGRVYAAAYRWPPDGSDPTRAMEKEADAPVPTEISLPALLATETWRGRATALTRGAWSGELLLAGTGVGQGDVQALAGCGVAARLAGPQAPAAVAIGVAWLGRRMLAAGRREDPLRLLPLYCSEPDIGPIPGPARSR